MFILFIYCIFLLCVSHFFTYLILRIREREFSEYRHQTRMLLTNINAKFDLFDEINNRSLMTLYTELNENFN